MRRESGILAWTCVDCGVHSGAPALPATVPDAPSSPSTRRTAIRDVAAGMLLLACQPTSHVVPDRVSCDNCEITVEAVVRIGTEDGPGSLLGRPTNLVADSAGRFWVSMLDHGFPFVFDRDGNFIRQVGSPGEGPAEFRFATVVAALPGDSVLLHAFPRWLVVGPQFTIDRVIDGTWDSWDQTRVVSWPDHIASLKLTPMRGGSETSIVVVELSGDRIGQQFGMLSLPGAHQSGYRRLDAGMYGFWVADTDRYFLRSYALDGTPADSLDRAMDWSETRRLAFGTPDHAPTAGINALRRDERGRLWVYIDRPRSDWQNAWRGVTWPTQGVSEVSVSSLPGGHVLWRTTVEIIDPARRRIIARRELDGHVFAVLKHDRIAMYEETPEGIPIITVYRLTLNMR